MNPELLLSRIRIVLVRPSHPGNIGAAARALKTMGLSRLYLVSPRFFPDAEASARATGAVDVLNQAVVTATLDEALAETTYVAALSARSRDLGPKSGMLRQHLPEFLHETRSGEVALVFGNETVGLSNDEILRCHATMAIPTSAEFGSLNLGAAVQVVCYECRMAAHAGLPPVDLNGATPCTSPLATHDEVEGLHAHLEQLMTQTGFFNPDQPGRLLPKLRRLLSRARLERDEVNILRGILASAQQGTGHGRKNS